MSQKGEKKKDLLCRVVAQELSLDQYTVPPDVGAGRAGHNGKAADRSTEGPDSSLNSAMKASSVGSWGVLQAPPCPSIERSDFNPGLRLSERTSAHSS